MTKTNDEKVYLVDGAHSSIIRLDGLESIRRLPEAYIEVTPDVIKKIKANALQSAVENHTKIESKVLNINILSYKPQVDGKLYEWNLIPWVMIDNRGFTMTRTRNAVYDVSAALSVYNGRLYGMYCTGDNNLLQNTGETNLALFKTGGALDLMIGSQTAANTSRITPVAGDCRLVITMVKGSVKALLYRAIVPGTKAADRIPFSSPSNTITFDKVDDVSAQVELAGKNGSYEFSVPLAVLGLKPYNGMQIRGDIGILRGKDGETTSRTYWNNKATGITADVPSEAMLTPYFWGTFKFVNTK